MPKQIVSVTTRVGAEGPYRVDLPLNPGGLNEQLFDIGLCDLPTLLHANQLLALASSALRQLASWRRSRFSRN